MQLTESFPHICLKHFVLPQELHRDRPPSHLPPFLPAAAPPRCKTGLLSDNTPSLWGSNVTPIYKDQEFVSFNDKSQLRNEFKEVKAMKYDQIQYWQSIKLGGMQTKQSEKQTLKLNMNNQFNTA